MLSEVVLFATEKARQALSNCGLERGVFEDERGKPFRSREASLNNGIPGPVFGGIDHELRVCFFAGDCLTPKKSCGNLQCDFWFPG